MSENVSRPSANSQSGAARHGFGTRFTGRGAAPTIFGGTWRSIAWRYGLAMVVTVLATLVRLWLGRSYGVDEPFIVHYPAVLLVASVAGGGPGALATVLSALEAAYWLFPPFGFAVETTQDRIALGIFTGVSLFLCISAEQLRRARWAKAVSAAQAEELALVNLGNLLVLDLDGRIIRWSEGCHRLYGFDRQEAEGRASHELLRTRFPQSREQAHRALMSQDRWEGELIQRRKDGGKVTVASTWALRRDTNDRPLAILEVDNDITDRKRAEVLLRKANAELAQKSAEIEQLLYTVSHDLKSPLVTIHGFLSHLSDDAAAGRPDRMADCIQRIRAASSRMTRLIDDLLNFSRIGRITKEPTEIRLVELVREVADSHAEELARKKISVLIQDEMPAVMGDRDRIYQVFDNLVVNAIKYGSDAAEPRIEIGATRRDEEVRTFVKDNGKGIAPEFQKKIFDLFHRLEHDKDGVGVGLAIVKKIVEVHGGRVWVESRPGEGATFWLGFPERTRLPDGELAAEEAGQ